MEPNPYQAPQTVANAGFTELADAREPQDDYGPALVVAGLAWAMSAAIAWLVLTAI